MRGQPRARHGWGPHLLCGAALIALLAAGCGGSTPGAGRAPAAPPSQPGAASAPPAPLHTVKSAYTTIAAAAAPWWMAQEAGYFREQGLDVSLSHIDAGAPLLAALTNGELDIAFSGAPTIVLGYIQGLETMIIGSTSSILDSIVFARPEYQRPEDLRGQTIGVTNLKAVTDVAARLGFKRIGLEPDVETGAVAGASLNVPAVFEARKRGFREILNVTEMGIPFMGATATATKRTLATRPEIAEPYLRALAQASSRLRTDRDFAIQVLAKYTRSTDEELIGATVDYYRPLYSVDPYPEPVALQSVIDAEDHPAARTLRPEDVIDARFAEALRRSGFLDRLPRD